LNNAEKSNPDSIFNVSTMPMTSIPSLILMPTQSKDGITFVEIKVGVVVQPEKINNAGSFFVEKLFISMYVFKLKTK
jgi:hypothetical protein